MSYRITNLHTYTHRQQGCPDNQIWNCYTDAKFQAKHKQQS